MDDNLRRLHSVTNQLALADSTDELCRQAILMGTAQLGFERLGIWLLDPKSGGMTGTYGTDEKGGLRDERTWRIETKASLSICGDFQRDIPFNLYEQVDAYDPQVRLAGSGTRALAGLWDGKSILGFLSADNFLNHQPITEQQCEMMGLYATSIGHLYSRLRADQQLRAREEQMRQSEKMAAMGRMAGGIAHDFNNILTSILGNSDLIQVMDKIEDVKAVAADIREAGDIAHKLVQELMTFSRKKGVEAMDVDLNGIVAGMRGMLERTLGKNVKIATNLAEGQAWIRADPVGLQQILLNLGVNGGDAMSGQGTLTLATARIADDGAGSGASIALSVRDTGGGMTDDVKDHLFEPFYTTKTRGTGFGLSIVYNLVIQFGGKIAVESGVGKGTEFKLHFPAIDKLTGL